MGTNGSFDACTLTDHLFKNFLIDEKSSLKGFVPHNEIYGQVGDDLWIYDPDKIIPEYFEKINLPINYSKSKMFTGENSVSEFCSRTFLNTLDVSRISPNIISKSKNFRYIPALLGLCSSRGIQLDASSFPTLHNYLCNEPDLTYLNKLQEWIVGMLLVSEYEESSYFKHLNYSYLVNGGWVTGDLIEKIYQDPKVRSRVMIAHSVRIITENFDLLKEKLWEIIDAMSDFGDPIVDIKKPEVNLFDNKTWFTTFVNESVGSSILTPKQIVALGRFKDQHVYIREDLVKAQETLYNDLTPKGISDYANELMRISHSSCYDEGNIRYDTDRLIGTQFKIVKTLERMDCTYTSISGLNPTQFRSLMQDLHLTEIDPEYEDYIPELVVDS
jgi:hypothetical protein